jgi:hypothetical protein
MGHLRVPADLLPAKELLQVIGVGPKDALVRTELTVSRKFFTVSENRGLAYPKDEGIRPIETSKNTQKASTVSSDTLSLPNLRLFTARKS